MRVMRREVFHSCSRQLVGRRPCCPGEDEMDEIVAGVQVGRRRVGGRGGSGGQCGEDGWRQEGQYFENPEGLCTDLDMSSSKSPYPLSD